MEECCLKCKHLFEMEDWVNYPNGAYIRNVCGAFAGEKHIMNLYGDLQKSVCECYAPRKATAEQKVSNK